MADWGKESRTGNSKVRDIWESFYQMTERRHFRGEDSSERDRADECLADSVMSEYQIERNAGGQ